MLDDTHAFKGRFIYHELLYFYSAFALRWAGSRLEEVIDEVRNVVFDDIEVVDGVCNYIDVLIVCSGGKSTDLVDEIVVPFAIHQDHPSALDNSRDRT